MTLHRLRHGCLLAIAAPWIVVLGLPLPCLADTIVQHKGPATLEVHFEPRQPKSRQLALSDTITVLLKIEVSPGQQITAPRQLPPAAPWLLDGPAKATEKPLDSARKLWQRAYRFAPREPGDLPFAFPDVQIQGGAPEPQQLRWDPIPFTVTTRITQPDRAGMRDITAIEAGPAPPPVNPSWHWWVPIALVPFLGAVLFGLSRFLRRKRSRHPLEWALYEWRRLHAMKLPDKGRSERFITLLTLLVREYLERDLDLPVRRQTTPEFLNAIAKHSLLREHEKRFLADFLQCLETVKFAHVAMTADQCREWGDKVLQFLQGRKNFPVQKAGQAHETLPVEKFAQSG